MRSALHRCNRHETRATRTLERAGVRTNAAEVDLGNRLPEGAVQS